jgi:CBS-domain-containing membrane protein
MTPGIHCCRDDDDLAKAVKHMEELKVRRLPVINKSKRMVGILSLGDISHSAPGALLTEWAKSVSAHHQRAPAAGLSHSCGETDRGPFVSGRVVVLMPAAARARRQSSI